MITADGLNYLTPDLPGIGGRLKRRPEDFIVQEVPLAEPTETGDHLMLLIEKRRRLTTDVVRFLSQHFGIPADEIGYAGLKDKHAVARQWFTVKGGDEQRAAQFEAEQVRLLEIHRHEKKLKRGKLAGNHFQIRLRNVEPSHVVHAQRIFEQLVERGAPNFIGAQRFGYRKDNHLQGRHLLLGDYAAFLDQLLGKPQDGERQRNQDARQAYEAGEYGKALETWPSVHRFERQALGPLSRGASAEHAVNAIDRTHRTLLVSAWQSAVFNRLLNDRLAEGRLDALQEGDLAMRHDTRGVFEVWDTAEEQPRCDRLEISPTGPMWGPNMDRAGGSTGERELAALREAGIEPEDLGRGEYVPHGSRRPFRMPITEPDIRAGGDEHGPYVYLSFTLPRGCFATVVLREIMKEEGAGG